MDNMAEARILLVDDDDANRYAVSRMLQKSGFRVTEAATGQEALRLADENPDVIILDVNLPDVNGIEVCKKIKSNPATSSLLVVHLSAHYISTEDRVFGLEEGADGYLTHPVDPAVLIATVNAYVRLHKAETALKAANAELSERVKARLSDIENLELEKELRERFVSTLTHDLRTPLTAARMSAQMVLRSPREFTKRQELLHRVIRGIDRVDGMIQDLLDANRIRAGQKLPLDIEHCDLAAVIRDSLDEMTTLHGNRFVFRSESSVIGKWSVDGSRRVLENLVNNAIKYGDPHSPIVVSLALKGKEATLSVSNEGEGIAQADIPTLFEAFRRAGTAESSGKRGWGLGLTLVRGIAEAHGGSASVESRIGKGTTFTIKFLENPSARENSSANEAIA